jgi:arginine deiminase
MQAEQTQKAQEEHQVVADEIRKEKDVQIASINNQLLDAVSQLRSRPNRAQASSNRQGGTGTTLSAEDSEFLEREAARADILRTGLQACYNQYDSLK